MNGRICEEQENEERETRKAETDADRSGCAVVADVGSQPVARSGRQHQSPCLPAARPLAR